MRSCERAAELREALAAEEPLSDSLSSHASTCASCARTVAATRRFDAGLESAMSELVTDALPPETHAIARTVPTMAFRRPLPRMVLSVVVTAALAAFAAVGVIVTGESVSNAIRGGIGNEPTASEQPMGAIDCYLGEPVVEITSERLVGEPTLATVAYCVGDADDVTVGGASIITCGLPSRSDHPEGREDASPDAYLRACTRVDRMVDESPGSAGGDLLLAPSVPFRAWEEAAEAVAWPLLRPQWVPDGYALAALQGFAPPTDPSAIDSVVATYLRNGMPLTIDQFVIAYPGAFRIELTLPVDDLADVVTGQTSVRDRPAFWADGIIVDTGGIPTLDVDTLVLTWSDGTTGYRLTSRSADLDELRRIAESLDG